MDSVPHTVIDLVDRFTENREAYESGVYNETQVRREFIDPFLKALGWDIDNAAGYAEAYKDVVHEDAIRIDGVPKAPDYSIRVGCTRKFFVEAKKPSVRVKDDPNPAYQLRRYGWSAKLPLSILTDFAELANVAQDRVRIAGMIAASESAIDRVVFRLYGISDKEAAFIMAQLAAFAEGGDGSDGDESADPPELLTRGR